MHSVWNSGIIITPSSDEVYVLKKSENVSITTVGSEIVTIAPVTSKVWTEPVNIKIIDSMDPDSVPHYTCEKVTKYNIYFTMVINKYYRLSSARYPSLETIHA